MKLSFAVRLQKIPKRKVLIVWSLTVTDTDGDDDDDDDDFDDYDATGRTGGEIFVRWTGLSAAGILRPSSILTFMGIFLLSFLSCSPFHLSFNIISTQPSPHLKSSPLNSPFPFHLLLMPYQFHLPFIHTNPFLLSALLSSQLINLRLTRRS